MSNYGNSAAKAKESFDFRADPDGPCRPERHLPGGQIGDESAITCSNIVFRVRAWVVEASTHTNDVKESSAADLRRTTKLARMAAKRIRAYRCGLGPPLCPR